MKDAIKFYNSSKKVLEIARKTKRDAIIMERKSRKFLRNSVSSARRNETKFRKEYDEAFQILERINHSLKEIDHVKINELKYLLNKVRQASSKRIQEVTYKYNHINSTLVSKAVKK